MKKINEKERFISPEIEIAAFDTKDVIMTSDGNGGSGGGFDGDWDNVFLPKIRF